MVEEPPDFDAFYRAQWHPMVRLAVLLVDDRGSAEDVVQDAFLAIRRRPPKDPDAATAYLRTVVVNNARSMLRHRATVRKHQFVTPPADTPGADQSVLVADEHREIMALLRELPRRQREVLVLRYWSHLTENEIASTLGISTGTVKSSASRGLSKLEAMLGGQR